MSGCVNSRNLKLAQAEFLAVLQNLAVFEIQPGTVINIRTSGAGQFQRTNHVVLIAVSFKNILNIQTMLAGQIQINLDIPAGVDHHRQGA